MDEFKNQHYLPFTYLKAFSQDPTAGRNASMIFRLGDPSSGPVKTAAECCGEYHYSESDPKGAESVFLPFENMHGRLKQALALRKVPKRLDQYFAPMGSMISIYLRNPSHENRLPVERIEAYRQLEQEFLHRVLHLEAGVIPTPEQLFPKLKERWRVAILDAPDGSDLLTSDSPAHMHVLNPDQPAVLMLMPMTPALLAVAYDQHILSLPNSLTPRDVWALNEEQASYCRKAVYFREEITGQVRKILEENLAAKKPAPGFISPDQFCPNHLTFHGQFGFVRAN